MTRVMRRVDRLSSGAAAGALSRHKYRPIFVSTGWCGREGSCPWDVHIATTHPTQLRKGFVPCSRSPGSAHDGNVVETLSTSRNRPSSVESGERTERLTRQEWLLVWLEILLAIGAVAGAVGIVWGDILGDVVDRLPFRSAVFASLALFVVNGLYPLVVVIGSLRHQQWVRWGHIVVGLALMGWIVVQVTYLGPPVHWLQIVYFGWGLAIAAMGAWLRRREARDPSTT